MVISEPQTIYGIGEISAVNKNLLTIVAIAAFIPQEHREFRLSHEPGEHLSKKCFVEGH